MTFARKDLYHVVFYSVHQSVYLVDAAAPKTAKLSSQGLRFAFAIKCRCSSSILLYEIVFYALALVQGFDPAA